MELLLTLDLAKTKLISSLFFLSETAIISLTKRVLLLVKSIPVPGFANPEEVNILSSSIPCNLPSDV